MVRKAFKAEQIINKLREAEVLLSQGATAGEASRKLGVSEQTCVLSAHFSCFSKSKASDPILANE